MLYPQEHTDLNNDWEGEGELLVHFNHKKSKWADAGGICISPKSKYWMSQRKRNF